MTTYVSCDKCGTMSLKICADGWRTKNADQHECARCAAEDIVKRTRREKHEAEATSN
jgi:hypothetical protein